MCQVEEVGKEDVVCTARNSAQLDGLLTVFHTERSADALQNVQNDLPILTDYDKTALKALLAHFEVDFVSLSFVREADDMHAAREYLDSLGHTTTKVRACHRALLCFLRCLRKEALEMAQRRLFSA